jgi:hypothetical protein
LKSDWLAWFRFAVYGRDVNIKPKRPTDINQLAKAVVDEATGQVTPKPERQKDPAAVALGKKGGRKGGLARARNLPKSRRKEIARQAAEARWSKK